MKKFFLFVAICMIAVSGPTVSAQGVDPPVNCECDDYSNLTPEQLSYLIAAEQNVLQHWEDMHALTTGQYWNAVAAFTAKYVALVATYGPDSMNWPSSSHAELAALQATVDVLADLIDWYSDLIAESECTLSCLTAAVVGDGPVPVPDPIGGI